MRQNVVSVYRLIVMRNKTPSLESTGPHSLNSTVSKTLFYIFHVSPEFLAALIIFAVNVRDVFGTGMYGDYRHKDPKPKTEADPSSGSPKTTIRSVVALWAGRRR